MPWNVAYRTGTTIVVKAVPNVSPAMMVTARPAQNTSGSSGNNAEQRGCRRQEDEAQAPQRDENTDRMPHLDILPGLVQLCHLL